MAANETIPSESPSAQTGRRGFLKKFFAVVLGGVATLIPVAAGVAVFLDPLRRKSSRKTFVRVTTLDALSDDGSPLKFPVLADRVDAWNRFSDVPIGAVYLRRAGQNNVEALNVVCPHAGCFVDFKAERGKFLCPCHNSLFAADGTIANTSSPAARPLDSLDVELRNEKEIWVKFQNFQAGKKAKIPVA